MKEESSLDTTTSKWIEGEDLNHSNSSDDSGESCSKCEMYRLIAENSSDGIFLATKFKLVYANPAFYKIIGVREVGDTNLLEFLDEKDAERIYNDVQRALKGELSEARYEVAVRRPDGKEIFVDLSMSKVNFKGRPHALGVIKDITDKKRMEQQLRHYNELLKLTNSVLRHDVLNNLNIISGAIELCERECQADKAVERCIDLINEIRELESLAENPKEVSISEIVKRVARHYDIQVDIKGDCKAKSSLAIVFDNLIRNSICHGKATKVEVNVESDSEGCTITFRDNGSGIPDEIQPRIFEKGFKFGENANTGLGLFIVKKVVEMLGGSVRLKRAGTFVIELKKR